MNRIHGVYWGVTRENSRSSELLEKVRGMGNTPFKMLCKAGEGVTSAFYQNGVKQSRSTCCLKQLLRKNHKVFHRTIFKTATKGRTFSLERMRDH